MGGRNAARFTVPSPSARFGFGFFSSINETVSVRTGAGLGASVSFAGVSTRDFAGARGVLATIFGKGVCFGPSDEAAGFDAVVAADVGLVLASLLLDSAAVERDGAAAFTGLRAGAVLRAVLFVVVLVAIRKF